MIDEEFVTNLAIVSIKTTYDTLLDTVTGNKFSGCNIELNCYLALVTVYNTVFMDYIVPTYYPLYYQASLHITRFVFVQWSIRPNFDLSVQTVTEINGISVT